MAVLTYIALAAAIVTLFLIPAAPRWGLPAFVLLLPVLNHTVPRAGLGLNAETVLYSVGIVAVLFRGRPTLPPPRYLMPVIAYFAVMLFSYAILATWYTPKMNQGVNLGFYVFPLKSQLWPTLGLFIFFSLAPDETLRRRILLCLSIALLVGAGSSLLTPGHNSGTDRLVGIFYRNPNEFGAFLGIFSVVPLMAFFRRGSTTPERAFAAVAYAVVLLALVLTQSRGSWLAYLTGHAVWLFYVNRLLLLPVAVALFFGVTTAYSVGMLPESIQERIEETFDPSTTVFRTGALEGSLDASTAGRLVRFSMARDMLMDSPIWGQGYRSFSLKDAEYGARYGAFRQQAQGTSAEGLYARVVAEQGLMGMIVLGWLAFVLLETGHRLAKLRGPERDLGVLLMSVLGATAINCATQGALLVHEVSVPFWIICGVAIHALRSEVSARRAVRQLEEIPALAPPAGTGELQPSR